MIVLLTNTWYSLLFTKLDTVDQMNVLAQWTGAKRASVSKMSQSSY